MVPSAFPPVVPSAFVVDLDGTALRSDGTFSQATKDAVHDAVDAGVPVIVATGRGEPQAVKFANELGLTAAEAEHGRPAWVINTLGTVATDAVSGKTLFSHPLPERDARDVIEYAQQHRYAMSVATDRGEFRDRDVADPALAKVLRTATQVDDLRRVAGGATIIRVDAGESGGAEMMDHFKDRADHLKIFLDRSLGTPQFSVTASGTDKGRALDELARATGLDPKRAYGFGDTEVDVPMFAEVAVPVAMANAAPSVQAAATYVTETNDQDGVAHAIERALGKPVSSSRP